MYCPKCGTENPDSAQLCRSCSSALTGTAPAAPAPDAKTSGLAIAALVLAILSPFTCFLTAIPAIILGIIGLMKIEKSTGRLKGKGLAIAGIAVPAVALPVALLLTGMLTFFTAHRSVRPMSVEFPNTLTWVKCRNPDCKHEYQMNLMEYFEYIEKNVEPASFVIPPLICQHCREQSVYRAVKCQECGLVFEEGSAPGDFQDRCPECGYSKIEEDRRSKAMNRRPGL